MYLLSDKAIRDAENKLGYIFKDKRLLCQAFVRASYANENPDSMRSNEVLEFVGDSVLSAAVVYRMTAGAVVDGRGLDLRHSEGELTKIRSNLTDRSNLSAVMSKLGLWRYLIMSNGDAHTGVADNMSTREDLMESLIGAVYIDSGNDIRLVADIVDRLLGVDRAVSDGNCLKHPKSVLQELCQGMGLERPEYTSVETVDSDNKPVFVVTCSVNGTGMGEGRAHSKKEAQRAAAQQALANLRQN